MPDNPEKPAARGLESIRNSAPIINSFLATFGIAVAIVASLWAATNFAENRLRTDLRIDIGEVKTAVSDLTTVVKTVRKEAQDDNREAINNATDLSKKIASHTEQIQSIEKNTKKIPKIEEDLDNNTTATMNIKTDTSEIKQIKDDVASIKDRLQAAKSHDITYIESFHIAVDEHVLLANHYGSVLVFPLNDDKLKELKELKDIKIFTQTDIKLPQNVIRKYALKPSLTTGWTPSRDAKRNPPKVVDQATLVVPPGSFSER